jgi:hypothetical protein
MNEFNMDTRPRQLIQHSWDHIGKYIFEYFGKDAWFDWLSKVRKCEHKTHTCYKGICY